MYQILLYYCYTPIVDPQLFREEHHQFCLDIGVYGRIIVAPEGLNGTVSGTPEQCQAYMAHIKADERFQGIDFKIESSNQHAFRKLNVRVKREIVHSSLTHLEPTQRTGIHVEPAEFKAMKDRDDVVLVDMRSKYEHELGRFKNAVTLPMDNFRDLPQVVDKLEPYKDKKIITYCTGGIKCEKASSYLLEQGFENVYQLHGGIIKYGLEEGGEDFEGKCYVFDSRISTDVNSVNPTKGGTCYLCGTESDHMVNCANVVCNRHTIICEACMPKEEGCCSTSCREDEQNLRAWNMEGYYPTKLNGYDPARWSRRKDLKKIKNPIQ